MGATRSHTARGGPRHVRRLRLLGVLILALAGLSSFVPGLAQARPLSQATGPAANIGLVLAPSTITADGVQQSTATATVTDSLGNPIAGEPVTITSTGTNDTITSVTDNGDGTYTAKISSTTSGTSPITAADGSITNIQTLTKNPGAAANIILALAPSTILADGTQQSTATATVTDAQGNGVAGEPVTITSGGTNDTVSSVTDHGNGTYTATITSTTSGTSQITAADGSLNNAQTLTKSVPTAANVTLQLSPSTITADGVQQSTATATVTDAAGAPLAGETVAITSTGTNDTISTVTDNGNGTYTATITSTTSGTSPITATDGTLTDTKTLTKNPGAAANITLALAPSTITADGSQQSTATATVTDAHNNGVPGEPVTIHSAGTGDTVSSVTDNGNGTYTATITSTTSGTSQITAADGSLNNAQTLTKNPGPAANISLALAPTTITANGAQQSTATATVTDAQGNGVPGEPVTITSTGTNDTISTVTDNGNGTYTATITSTRSGTSPITATDGTLTNTQTLTKNPGPAANISLMLAPSAITANGTQQSTATATVTDAQGNGVPGETVTIHSAGTGDTVSSVTDNGNGTYTATITSTKSGTSPITATDGTLTDTKTLTKNNGIPASVSLALAPSTIMANGSQQSVATATVTDAQGNAVAGEPVTITSAGTSDTVSSVTDHGDGTYTATITSTRSGTSPITAADGSLNNTQTLTKNPGPAAHIGLQLSLSTITANGSQQSVATATVTDASGNALAGAPVTITSAGTGDTVSSVTDHGNGTYTATITSSRSGTSPITAADGSLADTKTLTKVHGPAHSVTLSLSPAILKADGLSTTTASMSVTDANGNPVAGDRLQLSANNRSVQVGPVTDHGNGTYTAPLTSSNMPTTVSVIATDATVNPSVSGEATLTETSAPSLLGRTTMQWSFFFAPKYTKVLSLIVNGAPIGSEIQMFCHGAGCPFKRWFKAILPYPKCKRHAHHRCPRAGTYDVTSPMRGKRLKPGTRLVVEITQVGWIGKYYAFQMRPRKGPKIQISCVAPQGSKPGQGCS